MKKYAWLVFLVPLLCLGLKGSVDQQKALVDAIGRRKIDEVKELISDGVNVNQYPYAESYLHNACRPLIWSLELVTLLLEAGANVNVQSSADGSTPLHIAAIAGNPEVVGLLLTAGAQVNISDYEGNTPLHNAALWGSVDVVVALINAGADLEVTDNKGETLLHKAAMGNSAMTKWLLQENLSINAQDNEGNTPLHLAIQWYRADIVEALIEAGADLIIKEKLLFLCIKIMKGGLSRIIAIW